MKAFFIQPVSKTLQKELQNKIDQKTKPLGALGALESIAHRIGLIQDTLQPQLKNPHIIVFAGDHGVVQEGVSAYPQEVTSQMVLNFLNGGAAINVFAKLHGLTLQVVDSGVNYDFSEDLPLIHAKIRKQTRNFLKEPAMTTEECEKAIEVGAQVVDRCRKADCNIIGLGDMGIGNTSSASIITSLLCPLPLEACVGYGAGLDDAQLKHKNDVLQQAVEFHAAIGKPPLDILSIFGGYELAMMVGGYLQAAQNKMIILVDGFIASAAFLVAERVCEQIREYAFFSHLSQERGHLLLLDCLKTEPLLKLNMRLGEGTGCALAFPVIQSAVHFLNEMATFKSASVSTKLPQSPCPKS